MASDTDHSGDSVGGAPGFETKSVVNGPPIKVLIVDDEPGILELATNSLKTVADNITVLTETDPHIALDRLENHPIDCVISDYQMPSMNGLELLEEIQEIDSDLPFILFTGKGTEEIASEAISRGVTEYIQKGRGQDQFELLASEIQKVVRHRRTENRADKLLESAPDGIAIVDSDGHIRETNPELRSIFGYDRDELLGEEIEKLVPEALRANHVAYRNEYLSDPERRPMGADLDLHGRRKDGELVPIDISLSPMRIGDRLEVMAVVRDLTDRQELQNKAKREAELTEQIIQTSPVGIMVRDGETGRVTHLNKRAEELLPAGEIIGEVPSISEWNIRDEDGTPIDAGSCIFANITDVDEQISSEVLSIETEQGRRWLRVQSTEVDVDSRAGIVVSAFEDISKQQQLAHERTERLDRITDAFLSFDTEWKITYVNDKAASLLERGGDELVGENVWEQFPEAAEMEFYDAYQRAMETQEPVTFEEYFDPLDTWFSVRAFPSETGLSVYFRDITERKERERRYEAIFNQTFQFTGLMEPDGTLVEANETALAFGGLDREDVVGELLWDTYWFQHGDAETNAKEAVERARQGELFREEIEVQGADRVATIDFSVKPVTDEHDNVVLLVPEGRDITALKERERQLQQQNERLDEFASVVGHDLRGPLNIASGHLELARERGDPEYLEKAEMALDRIGALLDDLLTLARNGQVISETMDVSLSRVAGRAWDSTATEEASVDVSDVRIAADESRLQELFENLFSNAVEHGGDAVSVTVGPLDDEGFFVEDDGPGIPADQREDVFESGYSTSDEGTGFGLAIVNSIAEAHDWNVELADCATSGARFEITGVDILE